MVIQLISINWLPDPVDMATYAPRISASRVPGFMIVIVGFTFNCCSWLLITDISCILRTILVAETSLFIYTHEGVFGME